MTNTRKKIANLLGITALVAVTAWDASIFIRMLVR